MPNDFTSPEKSNMKANLTSKKQWPTSNFYENVPKNVIADLYRIYFHDFVMFGFSPRSVQDIYDAGSPEEEISENDKRRARQGTLKIRSLLVLKFY